MESYSYATTQVCFPLGSKLYSLTITPKSRGGGAPHPSLILPLGGGDDSTKAEAIPAELLTLHT